MRKWILSLILSTLCLAGCVDAAVTGASAAYGRQDITDNVSDRSITFTVNSNLYQHPEIYDHSSIAVTTFNGIVVMAGQVPSEPLREKAAYLASIVKGVKKVYNFIVVDKNTNVWDNTKDTWITTKIKAQLLTKAGIDPTAVKVMTESGTVYLIGNVTDEQAEKITTLARTTNGVKKVVQVFQYIKLLPHPVKEEKHN